MATISATVVTLNEEENIRKCLESLTWCDEIIIVDSHSDDNTVKIAQEYTDKIFTYERTGYGDPAREKALKEASGDWICMIDADERIPEEVSVKLRKLVEKGSYDVIYVPRVNYILGQWINCAGWWPDYRPVLHKKNVTILSDEIHNFISFSDQAREIYLDADKQNGITHFAYTGINDFISRMNRYTDIEAEQATFSYRQLLVSPPQEFINRYLLKQGFRKGFIGLLLAIFMSWYRFLVMAKAWQYENLGKDDKIGKKYES
jgi:glycosyltransferase involved in cell wall biosynthesis